MAYRLDGKRALVTGGSRGIGQTIVRALVDAGAKVIAFGKSSENLDKMKLDLPMVETVSVDLMIMNWDDTRREVEQLGPIDYLVNNAGIQICQPFLEADKESLDATLDVNIKAVFNVSQVVARGMVKDGRPGAIVNVSSIGSKRAAPDHSVYSLTKAALDTLTRHMAFELGKHSIRVNSVQPTIIMTEMGLNTWGDPAKAAPMLQRQKVWPTGRSVRRCSVPSQRQGVIDDRGRVAR
jgi:L-xylulose reductase